MRFSKTIARPLSLITLGVVLFIVATANRVETVPLPVASAAVSPTPAPSPGAKPKRPHPVRRFFSSVIHGIGGVFKRQDRVVCRLPPTVFVTSSSSEITVCPPAKGSPNCSSSAAVTLSATATAPEPGGLFYTWMVTGGRLSGEGRSVTWDLTGVAEGTYTATVEVNAGDQLTATASVPVTIVPCSDCRFYESPCPTISVSCPSAVESKHEITFEASFAGRDPDLKPTYTWSLNAGKIVSGQGTSRIIVDASDAGPGSITGTVSFGGLHPLCSNTASCTVEKVPRQQP